MDHSHSSIGFELPIRGGLSKVPGKFTDFEVALFTNPSDITKSSVNAAIRVASVDTGIAEMERSLRTAL